MADDNIEKKTEKKPHDFGLNHPYEALHEETIYSDDKRVGKIFGVNNSQKGEEFIRMLSESNKFDKKTKQMSWKANVGFNLYNLLHVDRVIVALRKISAKLGWKLAANEEIEQLKTEIQRRELLLAEYKVSQERLKAEHNESLKKFAQKIEELSKTRLPTFKSDLEAFEKKLAEAKDKKILESELQHFLYSHSWLFGLEYITSEPQKLRGAHSKFDFYLERYNKTNDIVEIKLISDEIINKDGSISAKVVQAVDQLIQYMESAIAAAHSTVISEEEGIRELRPRGIVIIGSDGSEAAAKKLHQWNYQLAHIQIMTYDDLLKRAKNMIGKIEGKS